jgi:ADP-ribose pyrophosphatase YjhB (NUDIX family)
VYVIYRDDSGRVLLVPMAQSPVDSELWTIPGGVIHHGEEPLVALLRTLRQQTNLAPGRLHPRAATADVHVVGGAEPVLCHHERLIFDAELPRPRSRPVRADAAYAEAHLTLGDGARWAAQEELAGLALDGVAAAALGVPSNDHETPDWRDLAAAAGLDGLTLAAPDAAGNDPDGFTTRRQRFASYGLVTDASGRVLLSLIATGYPGAGRWHLPGGGTDFGESPASGLLREIVEETGQRARIGELLTVAHRYTPGALGPEGVPLDWHAVRVVFRAYVDEPTQPAVVETQGSTAGAAWFPVGEATELTLTEIASEMINLHLL